jgi:integrase
MSGGHLIGAFLEMMSAERGAAKNTIDAYRRDLGDYAGFVAGKQQTLLTVPRETVNAYLDQLRRDGLSASSSARRLSAIRQFHRFLCADNMRGDDPTRIVASPKSRRALPKVLSIAEVDKLLVTAEVEANAEASEQKHAAALRLYVLLELLYATGMRVSELVSLRRSAVMRDTSYHHRHRQGRARSASFRSTIAPEMRSRPIWRRSTPVRSCSPRPAADGHLIPPGLRPRPQGPGRPRGASVRPASHRTSSATPSPAICWPGAPICAWCKCCWATPTSRPRRSTPMCSTRSCAPWSRPPPAQSGLSPVRPLSIC